MRKQLFITLTALVLGAGNANAQLGKLINKKKAEDKKEQTEQPAASDTKTTEAKTDEPADAPSTGGDDADETLMTGNARLWLQDFPGGVDWFSLTSGGTLVVSANRALTGIDGTTGKVLWQNEKFGGISQENFAAIEGSPYVAIVSGGMFNRHQTIINTLDGSIVADTRNFGVKHVSKRYPVPNQNGFVLSAFSDGKPTVFMIDNNSGKVAWKIDKVFEKTSETLLTRPYNVTPSHFFVATDKRIYKLNSLTGTVENAQDFKTPLELLKCDETEDEGMITSTKDGEDKGAAIDKARNIAKKVPLPGALGKLNRTANTVMDTKEGIEKLNMKGQANEAASKSCGKFFKLDDSDNLYYFNNKHFVGINAKTGEFLYEPFKFDDDIATFIPHKDGAIFATDEKKSELYYIDYKTGKNMWAKSPQLRGRINKISLNEGKIAVSSAKEKGKNYVNIIDINTGAEVTKRDMKVQGQVTNIFMVKRGLIYSTTSETNIQDPETGKDVIKKSLKYNSGGASIRKDGKFYIINDSQVDVIDETTGDVATFASLDFKDREKPQNIELRETGILVSSPQNMVLLDFNGKEKYHTFLQAPGVSTAGKILGGLAMASSVMMSAAHGAAAGQAGFGTSAYNHHQRQADNWGNIGQSGLEQFTKRFNMSVGSNDFQIILTKIKNGEDKGFNLVKVNKDTGKEMGNVVIGDKKPDYIFDPYNSIIYYRNRGKKISGFKL